MELHLTSGHHKLLLEIYRCMAEQADTVKPVLMASCIQRPPVLKGHSVMSQRCLRNIF